MSAGPEFMQEETESRSEIALNRFALNIFADVGAVA
jgi:hypothetical protein